MRTGWEQAQIYQSILDREKGKINDYMKWHYGDCGVSNYFPFYNNAPMVGEWQRSSQQLQYRKQLMARLFDEALPFIVSEARYGLALNKEEQICKIKERFKNEANDYWIFKKLIQLKNWNYPSFLHVIDLYILANLYLQKVNMDSGQELRKTALILNLGMSYIPKNILHKSVLSKEEKNIQDHHSLWSMEMVKEKVSQKIHRVLYQHYNLLFNLPVKEESKEVLLSSKILTVLDQYSELTLLGKSKKGYSAPRALSLLTRLSKRMEAMPVVRKLMELINIYPEGTIVELSNGARAQIQKTNKEVPFLPHVKECQSGKEYNLPLDQSIIVNYPYPQETEEKFIYYDLSEDLTQYAYQLFDQKCKGRDGKEVYIEVVLPSLQKLLRKNRNPVLIEKLFLKWMWEKYSTTKEHDGSKL